jgi:hypothetical protein
VLPWQRQGWSESVETWIDSTLDEAGIDATGPVEHLRQLPWAAIAVVPTRAGAVYFKASAPSEAFEAALTLELARRRPDCMPDVIAIDAGRGWMLTHDAGLQLRDQIPDPPDPTIWDELLPLYAELQIGLADSVEELVALGTPDRRFGPLVAAYQDVCSRWEAKNPPEIDGLVDRLGDTVPASIVHEEFQDNNIHLTNGRPTFIDWAEAAVEHPFAGLVNTMRGLVDRWGFEPGDPGVLRLRDLYLEPWTRFAAMPDLVELFALGYALGMVCRALTWDRLVWRLSEPTRAEYAHFVPAWLELLSETLEGKATLGT